MIIKGKKVKLREDWLNDDKTMIITSSAHEIKNKLLASSHMMRVLVDGIIDKYMICDGYNNVHEDMILAALENYYYPFPKGFLNSGVRKIKNASNNIFISYVPKGAKEASDIEKLKKDMASDSYTTQYIYDQGYIFSQEKASNRKFTDCELFKVLGECQGIENIEESLPLIG